MSKSKNKADKMTKMTDFMKYSFVQYFFLILFIGFSTLVLVACDEEEKSAPDVSFIQFETKIVRFDSLLYAIKDKSDLARIRAQYPTFYSLYFNRILGLRNTRNDDTLIDQVNRMLSAETFTNLRSKIDHVYLSTDVFSPSWNSAMTYYSYYFDTQRVPDLYTVVTEFAFGSFIFPLDHERDGIGLSLDMFLGDQMDYSLMAKMDPVFSSYNTRTFNQDHVIKKAVDALLDDLIPHATASEFIHHLIREGKKYYISDHILPFTSDTVIWEYTTDQWRWIQDNEWNLYSHLITNEFFYSKSRGDYIRLINPSPHTYGLPPEAPGRAGIYIGYKIVQAYMKRYPNTTFKQLVELDGSEIFQAAKYKPPR